MQDGEWREAAKLLTGSGGWNSGEFSMSAFLENEKAAEISALDQPRELFDFLREKVRVDGPAFVMRRIFSAEEMNDWMDEDEVDLLERTRDA